ncbi:MAG: restriction endonuclease subunit S [Candidatus Dormibacteria bacterium]
MTRATTSHDAWQVVRFGDVVRCVNRTTRNPAADGLDRVVGLDHMEPRSLPLRRWDQLEDLPDGTSFTRTFKAGQVLFGKRRAYQRKVSLPDFDGVCSGDILVFEVSNGAMLPDFLPYVVQSDDFFEHALGTSAGSLSPRTKWQDLAKYEFALPPIEEQRHLITIMRAIGSSMEALRSVSPQIALLSRALESGTWEEPFADHRLGEIADVTVGIVVRPADLYVKVGGVPALRSLNIAPNRILNDDMVYISETGHAQHKKSSLSGGDVVVVRSGRPGDAAVIPSDSGARNAVDLLIVRCHDSVKPEYLCRYLNSSVARRQLLGRSAGTAQQHLNASQLKQILVPVAHLGAQERLLKTFRVLDHLSEEVRRSLNTSSALASALLEGLLREPVNV